MPKTWVQKVTAQTSSGALQLAGAYLRNGQLVAFPTETVYGLGANALDADAVAKIFKAKGRPATNPIIVHIMNTAAAMALATLWPKNAQVLADAFWPGPLTLVVKKADIVPDIVTAGGPTVALRVPKHSVAQALLKAADVPLAAPSANRSTQLSPTCAVHVLKGLKGRIAGVIDGGPCQVGLESTVVDVSGDAPVLLRPGTITVPMLEAVIGPVMLKAEQSGVAKSPGLMKKHYAPRTPLLLVDSMAEARELQNGDDAVGIVKLPRTAARTAVDLYAILHEHDEMGLSRLVLVLPPDTPDWAAVRDRLMRAAYSNESNVQ